LILVALLVISGQAAAGQPGSFTSQSQLDEFVHGYYLNPRPELVGSAILFYDKEKLLERENARPPVLAFFTLVFQKNRDLTPQWSKVIESTRGKTREVLSSAMSMAGEEAPVMKIHEHSPSINDMYWGAFLLLETRGIWGD
jgi:hypothetical protein